MPITIERVRKPSLNQPGWNDLRVMDLIKSSRDIEDGIYRLVNDDETYFDDDGTYFIVLNRVCGNGDDRVILIIYDNVIEPFELDCWEDNPPVEFDPDAELSLGIQFSDGTQFNLE